ncbi:hypothetical protein [Enterococcus durans]|nr:hypothetical protein [Enterococcus durans]
MMKETIKMLDDKLKCPQCQTKFYYNEVTNVVHHRKKEMPIRCPQCDYTVKKKLSHGYFVTYKEEEFENKNIDLGQEPLPEQYKNIKTGAIISSEDYQRLIEENDRLLNGPMSSELMGGANMLLENEELNSSESYEDYVPYHED